MTHDHQQPHPHESAEDRSREAVTRRRLLQGAAVGAVSATMIATARDGAGALNLNRAGASEVTEVPDPPLASPAVASTPNDTPGPNDIPPGAYEAPVVRTRPAAAPPIALRGSAARRPLSITRVGHSSVLIDFDGKTILTDPWFTDAPYFHHGEALGMGVGDLPRLTAIVASHAHYDHFHIEGMTKYRHKDVPVIVGFPDMAARARAAGFTDVRVVKVGRNVRLGRVDVLALPGAHGVPEITFLLRSGGNSVYFGGDTLLTPEVQAIASYAPVDVALLSVNGLRSMGEPVVMSAEEAAVFAHMLRATVAVPTHYAFRGGPETEGILSYNGTAERFIVNLRRSAPATIGRILEPGQLQRFTSRTTTPS